MLARSRKSDPGLRLRILTSPAVPRRPRQYRVAARPVGQPQQARGRRRRGRGPGHRPRPLPGVRLCMVPRRHRPLHRAPARPVSVLAPGVTRL